MIADQREAQPKGYTSHEVTAPRAACPSGRTPHQKRKAPAKAEAFPKNNFKLY